MRITKEVVENWLKKHAPDMGAYENPMNHIKGIYRLDAGPAHSLRGLGKTWREVLAALEAME